MIPDRLAGWWLASVAGTAAVLAFSPPGAAQAAARRRSPAAARALAEGVRAALAGDDAPVALENAVAAKHELMELFDSTPFRPLGLAAPDQAMANVVQLIEWCTSLLSDAVAERDDLHGAAGRATRSCSPRAPRCSIRSPPCSKARARSPNWTPRAAARGGARRSRGRCPRPPRASAAKRRSPSTRRRSRSRSSPPAPTRWSPSGAHAGRAGASAPRVRDALELASGGRGAGRAATALRHASVRSVWFVNSLRAAVALSVAVLVAELSSRPTRLLGRPRHAVGAAHQRRRDRRERVQRARRHGARVLHRRRAADRDRRRIHARSGRSSPSRSSSPHTRRGPRRSPSGRPPSP